MAAATWSTSRARQTLAVVAGGDALGLWNHWCGASCIRFTWPRFRTWERRSCHSARGDQPQQQLDLAPLTGSSSDASVRRMKTLPLRQLLRDPKAVKKLTLSGFKVRITDGGKPLWDISPSMADGDSVGADADAHRHKLWDEHYADLASTPKPAASMPSMAEVMALARGSSR